MATDHAVDRGRDLVRGRYWAAAGMLCLVLLVVQGAALFDVPAAIDNAGVFGTVHAPRSDALLPWLQGGLAFMLDQPRAPILYRPTVGVFWAALIGWSENLRAIALFFALWTTAVLAILLIAWRNHRSGRVLAIFVSCVWVSFRLVVMPTNVATLMIDFAALCFGVVGVLMVSAAEGTDASSRRLFVVSLLLGAALLGVVAAIRGLMLIGGPALIAAMLWRSRVGWSTAVLTFAAFAAPVALDVGLQQQAGVVNNGFAALYCTYAAPEGSWTGDCHARYLALRPPATQVLADYAAAASRAEFWTRIAAAAGHRLAQDAKVLRPAGAVGALIIGWTLLRRRRGLVSIGVPFDDATDCRFLRWLRTPLAASVLLAIGLALHAVFRADTLLMFVMIGLGILVLARGRAVEIGLMTGYLGCVLVLLILHFEIYERMAATASFLPLLAACSMLVPAAAEGDAILPKRWTKLAYALVGAGMVFLYSGLIGTPSGLASRFRSDVVGRPERAMLIAVEPTFDRSLFLLADMRLAYARYTPGRIGDLITFDPTVWPSRVGNDSYLRPNPAVPIDAPVRDGGR